MDSEVRTRCFAFCSRQYAVDNLAHVDVSMFDALLQAAELAAEDEVERNKRLLHTFVLAGAVEFVSRRLRSTKGLWHRPWRRHEQPGRKA